MGAEGNVISIEFRLKHSGYKFDEAGKMVNR